MVFMLSSLGQGIGFSGVRGPRGQDGLGLFRHVADHVTGVVDPSKLAPLSRLAAEGIAARLGATAHDDAGCR
jgi:hypothetical protein